MTKLLPKPTIYNSDSHKRTCALWRLKAGGILEEGYYNYETGTVGPYKFTEPYGYAVEWYVKKPTPPIKLLYHELLNSQDAVATMFVNNSFVATVYRDCIRYKDLDTGEICTETLTDFENSEKMLVDIGWVKTYIKCQQACYIPFKLYMDVFTYKAYIGNGVWVDVKGIPEIQETINFPMYKSMFDKDVVAVYNNLQEGSYSYFTKEGNLI